MEEHNQDRSAYKDHVPAPPLPLKHPFYKELLFDRLLHGVMCFFFHTLPSEFGVLLLECGVLTSISSALRLIKYFLCHFKSLVFFFFIFFALA